MQNFKNILIFLSGDENPIDNPALARGIALSRKNDARLTLMDVIPSPENAISAYKGIIKPEELIDILVSRREKEFKNIAEQVGEGIDIKIKVVLGKDFIEIIRQVVFDKHDLLIKVANEHPDSFDSSDFHLMRKCPQPVWLLKPKNPFQSKKILAAIDLNLESDADGKAMNAMIMDLASSLASWENKELHVLSCWSLYGEQALRDGAFFRIPEDKLESILKSEERSYQALQNTLISQFNKSGKIQGHLIKGKPVEHIPAFVNEHEIEVVVMGTVARSGIPGLLIGNTSETILGHIRSSVITLKPSGFESIIK